MKFWEPIARRSSSVSCRSLTPGAIRRKVIIVTAPFRTTFIALGKWDDNGRSAVMFTRKKRDSTEEGLLMLCQVDKNVNTYLRLHD